MPLPPLDPIQNQTPADAIPVNSNFQTIRTHIDTNLIDKSGSVAMDGPLILADGQPAISVDQAAALIPIGLMMDWPAPTTPAGGDWVLCDGRILTKADYPDLHALIGGTYDEPGDSFGGTQFRVPNLTGRSSIGLDGDRSVIDALGKKTGRTDVRNLAHTHDLRNHTHSISHTHTLSHTHSMGHTHSLSNHTHSATHNHTASSGNQSANHTHGFSGSTSTGGAHTHTFNARQYQNKTDTGSQYNTELTSKSTGVGNPELLINSSGSHSHSFSGTTGGISTSHSHTITVNSKTMSTGGPSTTNTGNTNTANTAGASTSTTSGASAGSSGSPSNNSTSSSGDAGSNDNFHPVLTLYKIMKAR